MFQVSLRFSRKSVRFNSLKTVTRLQQMCEVRINPFLGITGVQFFTIELETVRRVSAETNLNIFQLQLLWGYCQWEGKCSLQAGSSSLYLLGRKVSFQSGPTTTVIMDGSSLAIRAGRLIFQGGKCPSSEQRMSFILMESVLAKWPIGRFFLFSNDSKSLVQLKRV